MAYACRHCGSVLGDSDTVIDLGHQPPSNSYLTTEQLAMPEVTYPLKVYVCPNCWLVQLPAHASAEELFTADYAYFSSTSSSWCAHAEQFVTLAVERLDLDLTSHVVELASNDGYLLQYFKKKGISCLGIEPTHATAEAARGKGIETIECFFGLSLAEQLEPADLVVANNVLAHVPDINDFVAGIARLLKINGRASIEFPHLLRLLIGNQFDTIYHEHYSYLSLRIVQRIAHAKGMDVVDVEELPTHGGSLRVWLAHKGIAEPTASVLAILHAEAEIGLEQHSAYSNFQTRAERAKFKLLQFLLDAKRQGKRVLGYGAAAKGNTLLNYTGVHADLLEYVGDLAISKQNKFLPGSHIPVISPEQLAAQKFDSLLVLPWNLIDEVTEQFPHKELVTAIPDLRFCSKQV
ncbi:class I SAM-dependent methyltransferase [Synechococcus sp. NOUM97013]|uniref:class I SAM-dependent methyltransferase n=1 Tax=Synechococcus sp. NOUM97013 TaxID=1442555 RepID=UPI001647ECAE|nr:class I SAM-dependent methyltransferase [Synechococcus sp. NOUM97013]QNI72322.1 S-adenosyl-L-methionine-dependent methyltransferase [Synechococcus sp. NOUM97013]